MKLLSSLVFLLPLLGADSAEDILKRYIEADARNEAKSQDYTYTSEQVQFQYDRQGKQKSSHSKTFEMIFVEGKLYRKLVAADGHPLSPGESAKEEKRLQETAEERRKQERSTLLHKSVSSAKTNELLDFYRCHADGEDTLNGRPAWVLQCDPRTDYRPADQHQKDMRTESERLWIDKVDSVALRIVHTALEGNPVLMPGFTITTEYAFIKDDAWLPISIVMDGRAQFAKVFKPKVRTEYKNSNFQKFDVKSTITVSESPR